RHIAALARSFLGALHVVANTGIALEIGLDVGPRFGLRNPELLGQAEGADAVDDAEIDRLGAAADHRIHALDGNAENLARRQRMNVEPGAKRLLQRLDAGHFSGEPELDLRVIYRKQGPAFLGDEGSAN